MNTPFFPIFQITHIYHIDIWDSHVGTKRVKKLVDNRQGYYFLHLTLSRCPNHHYWRFSKSRNIFRLMRRTC